MRCINCAICLKYIETLHGTQKTCSSKRCKAAWQSKHAKERYRKYITGGNNKYIKNAALRIRFEVLKRDNFTCQYCGKNTKDDHVKLNIDHKIPRVDGGDFSLSNLVTSCFDCNMGKGDVLLHEREI